MTSSGENRDQHEVAGGAQKPLGSSPGGLSAAQRVATDAGEAWELHRRIPPGTVLLLLAIAVVLSLSFNRIGLLEGLQNTGGAFGLGYEFLSQAFPIRLETAQRVERLVALEEMRAPEAPPPDPADREEFKKYNAMLDPNDLPLFTYIELRPKYSHDPYSEKVAYFVDPLGYVKKCSWLLLESIEMALWGTILCMAISAPLSIGAASNFAPGSAVHILCRMLCSFFRAIPELILAILFVVMYGPGPVAGILALGIHTSGFLAKFIADDIENTDRGPQDALKSTGANRLKVLRLAVVPQVMPQYVAYMQYIFERNIRTATVVGIVGAGGIGFEMMQRFDNGNYDMVATILLLIFITVFLLEHISQWARSRLIQEKAVK